MGRPGSGNTPSPDMSDRDLAELVAQVWERAGYPTRVEHYEGKTFVVAGTRPKSADLMWVVPAMENQQLAASWIGLYEAILEDLQVGQPYLVTTGGASDEAERAADRSEVVLVTRDNLATLLEQSGIGTDRLEISSSRASPSSPPAAEGTESETAAGTRTDVGGAGSVNPETKVGPGGRTDEPGGGPGADVDPSAKDDTVTGAFEGEGTTGAESADHPPSSDSEDGAGPGAADDESTPGSASEEETDGRKTGSSGDSATDHGSEDDGVAMVFDDESGGDSPGSSGAGTSGPSGGGSDLDSILDEGDGSEASEADGSSRRGFVKVGLGIIGISLVGIVDRLWLHFVLGGSGGLPSYNETRVKQDATTVPPKSLVGNVESLTSGEDPMAVKYEGVVLGSEQANGYQRLEVQIQSGDRDLIARWDGDPLSVGDQFTLWGVFVETETIESDGDTTERPVVDVVSVTVSGGAGGPTE
ncbi:MAG: hypothetical protein ACI8VE_003043 [Natrialbaceae archaeon]|jgi:hypothetical protein